MRSGNGNVGTVLLGLAPHRKLSESGVLRKVRCCSVEVTRSIRSRISSALKNHSSPITISKHSGATSCCSDKSHSCAFSPSGSDGGVFLNAEKFCSLAVNQVDMAAVLTILVAAMGFSRSFCPAASSLCFHFWERSIDRTF